MRFLLFTVAVVATLSLAGCEGGPVEGEGEGREGEGEGGDVDDRVEDLVDAFLTFLDECEPFGPIARYEPLLAATSLPQFERADLEAQLQGSLDNPALSFNANEFNACIDELERCAPVFGEGNEESACNRLFDGLREAGEGCAATEECVDGLDCIVLGDGVDCGVCRARPVLGESCDGDPAEDVVQFVDCAEGFICEVGPAPTCRTALGLGDACDVADDACDTDLVCVDGECVADVDPVFAAGDACTTTCGGLQAGLACDGGVCVVIGVAQPGQPCDPDLQNPTVWCVNTIAFVNACVPGVDPDDGVCTVLPGAGSDCLLGRCSADVVCDTALDECVTKPGAGGACVNGDTCDDGFLCNVTVDPPVCVNPPTAGQACVGFNCADDHVCGAGDVCQELPGEGEACPDGSCASLLVCQAGTCVDEDDDLVCAE